MPVRAISQRGNSFGDALPAKPAWASRTQDSWAAHVAARDGRYLLYCSAKPDAAVTDAQRGLCLAVATAARPEGTFTDMGHPLQCGTGFVNIDPMAYDDPPRERASSMVVPIETHAKQAPAPLKSKASTADYQPKAGRA